MSGTTKFQFWFEFASTYSYVAASRIDRVASAAKIDVEWRPFLLGPIFSSQGWNDSPFNLYPAKGRYMWRDMERWCGKAGIPFRKPSVFPRNGLLAARVACAQAGELWIPEFVRAVYHANFAEDRDISSPAVIGAIIGDLGHDGRALVERAGLAESKERLRAQTEEAIALGIFGAPSFIAAGELFWGNDRLEDAVAWHLQNCSRG